MCKAACDDIPPNTSRNVALSTTQAMEQQMCLPPEFLLRGFLVTGWHNALLPHGNPKLMMTQLHLGLWRILFAQVWELRNKHNNHTESIASVYERNQLVQELREWKRTRTTRLGAHQSYLAEYDLVDIQRQQTSSLKTRIEILTIAARNWRKSCKSGQKLITQYFIPDEETR